jgi:hypothetical protein
LKVRAQKYSDKLAKRRKHLNYALDSLENVVSSYTKM